MAGTWSTAGPSGGTGRVSSSRCGRTTPTAVRRVRHPEGCHCRAAGRRDPIRRPGHHGAPAGPHQRPGLAADRTIGNLDPKVWYALSAGEEIVVPGLGAELLHRVHADDVAQAFQLAIEHRDAAGGSRSTWWR